MPRSVDMRLAALLGVCAVIALLVGGCREQPFEAGELGAVEVGPGEPVELAVMLSFSGAPAFGEPIAKAIRLAIEDYGDVHGHPCADRRFARQRVLARRRTPRRPTRDHRAADGRSDRHHLLISGDRGVPADLGRRHGDDLRPEHRGGAHLRPCRKPRGRQLRRLLPRLEQRSRQRPRGGAIHLRRTEPHPRRDGPRRRRLHQRTRGGIHGRIRRTGRADGVRRAHQQGRHRHEPRAWCDGRGGTRGGLLPALSR